MVKTASEGMNMSAQGANVGAEARRDLSQLHKVRGVSAGSGSYSKRYFESSELFAGGREVLIRHRGQEYRLLLTRTEKLILNK
jgi:hemin uptake protein HemP